MLTVKSFVFSPVQENTYVLSNEENLCFIVDPGCYFNHERNELKDYINEHKLAPKYLLNTHCHLDHVFGNQFVFNTYGTPLHLHPKEKQVLEYAPISAMQWSLPFDNYKNDLVFLKEGETVSLGKDVLRVLFCPGHSPGHICFYCEEQEFVIGGDVLFNMSIGRTDLPGGNYNTLIHSIRQQLFVLPDEVVVYPGHGASTTIGYEKKHNPFLSEA